MIGSESSHAAHFATALYSISKSNTLFLSDLWANDGPCYVSAVQHLFPKVKIVDDVESAIKRSDAVIITLRRASEHYDFTALAIKHRKPVFVDKPFTDTVTHAQKLIKLGTKHEVQISGGSTLCFLSEFIEALPAIRNARNIKISFFADPASPYEGYRFYGSHLTDLYSAIANGVPQDVSVCHKGEELSVNFEHNKQTVSFVTRKAQSPLMIFFDDEQVELSQTDCYKAGMENFIDLVEGKTSGDSERLLRSVKLMTLIEDKI